MFRSLLYLILVVSLFSCRVTHSGNEELNTSMVVNKYTPDNVDGSKAIIEFYEGVYKFGKISEGEKVDFVFKFTNTGDAPLVLAMVKPSCGCTITKDWPKDPILPGEGGEIAVEFNSEGKKGRQSKSINVVSNTLPATTVLYFEGEVITPNY